MAAALGRIAALLPPQSRRDPFLSRVVAAMFACGGLMMLVALLLPRPASGDDRALWIITMVAFLVGAAVLAGARHIPRWLAFGLVAGFSAIVCGTIYASGIGAGMYSTMLIWAALLSAYFFSARAALAQLCWGLACYAVTLALVGSSAGFSPFTRWLLTAFALAVAVAVTTWLVARRKATEDRADRFFRLSRDMLCTADEDGHFRELNPAWIRTLGWSDEELCARPFLEFVHPEDRERTVAETARLFSGEDTVSFQNRYRAKDGVWHWLDWSATYSPTEHLVYARATDVTKRKSLESEREALVETLRTQARKDALTDLPNRRWLAEELQRELAWAGRQGFELCAAVIDLDHFKRFNDERGHPAGDKLLRECAEQWRDALRTTDFLARYGGEEFVVLLPDCSLADAQIVIERVRAATPGGQTCSAGIATWERWESGEQLIARADAALYSAKDAGRDRAAVATGAADAATVLR